MSKRLQGKVTVITGGNSGIGKGIAKRFLSEGAKVVIFGRDLNTLNETKEALEGEILAIQGDVTRTDDLENLYKTTEATFGKIDVLVANAGIAKRIHIDNASEENFDHMTDINFKGVFFTIKYALAYFNQDAAILLISSVSAHMTIHAHSIYSSGKAAIKKLAQNLSYDLADRSIRVNSISPGYIETPHFDAKLESDPDFFEKRKVHIPLNTIGTPEDIANAALFLCSDEASYITGADLVVDGGLSSYFPIN